MRGMTSTVDESLQSSNVPFLVLVELDFAEGVVRLTNAAYSFKWDPRGSLITDSSTLSLHSLYTTGTTAQITDLGSTISGGTAHVYFQRTGTTGSDRRVKSATITLDKSQGTTVTIEAKAVQGAIDFYVNGSAVDDQPSQQQRFATLNTSAVAVAQSGCSVSSQQVLPDGYTRFSIWIPAAFWTGSGASCYIFAGCGWNVVETREYYYRIPTFQQEGYQWTGAGDLGSISPIEEGMDLQMYGCTLTLSGIASEYIAKCFGTGYSGRNATLWIAPLDSDYQILSDPIIVFKGQMDTMPIKLGDDAAIQVSIESKLVSWERAKNRRYNHEDQRSEFPNDRGFEFVPQMTEKEIRWGYK